MYKFILTIIVIIILLLVEFNFRSKERFDAYDLDFNNDIYVKNAQIGVKEDPQGDKLLTVDGTLKVKDQFCIKDVCLTKNNIQKIKRLPLFNKNKLCLKDDNGDPICVDEKMLGMLSGHRTIRFRNARNETLTPIKIKHHGFDRNYWYQHDDNDDTSSVSGFRFPETKTNLYYHEGSPYFETLQFADYEHNKESSEFTMLPAKKEDDYPSEYSIGPGVHPINYSCYEGPKVVDENETEVPEPIIYT